jgi:ATP-dependent protease ClpP protease subunit
LPVAKILVCNWLKRTQGLKMFELLMDGDIGLEVTLAGVLNDLVQAGGDDLLIKVSSNGGMVAEGTAIRNVLSGYAKENNAKIIFDIIGWAQSAMSYITTIPGAVVRVYPNTVYMYHNPWDVVAGDSEKFAQKAKFLDALRGSYAASYAEKSGIAIDKIKTQMKEETVLTGQDIVDAGFADEMIQDNSINNVAALAGGSVVELSKQNYLKTYSRLCAVAYGIEKKDGNSDKNNLPNGEKNMSDKKKTPEEIAIENSRVKALASAVEAMPEKTAQFNAFFAEGKTVEFFNGLIAVHESDVQAKAAAKKKEDADNSANEGARAAAFASAVTIMPGNVKMLQKHFADGKSADFFNGLLSSFEASAAAKAQDDAASESPGDLSGDGSAAGVAGGGSATVKAAGATGQTVRV